MKNIITMGMSCETTWDIGPLNIISASVVLGVHVTSST